MKLFHAHIYFPNENLAEAYDLFNQVKTNSLFDSVCISENPIGPHPTGMIELQFNDQNYSRAIEWVEAHRKGFSALVHQDTGDDLADHSKNSLWLGVPLDLNFSFFELIKNYPGLRIHK